MFTNVLAYVTFAMMAANRIELIGLSVLVLTATATAVLAQNTSNPMLSGNTVNPYLSGNSTLLSGLSELSAPPALPNTLLQPNLGRNSLTGLPCTGVGALSVTPTLPGVPPLPVQLARLSRPRIVRPRRYSNCHRSQASSAQRLRVEEAPTTARYHLIDGPGRRKRRGVGGIRRKVRGRATCHSARRAHHKCQPSASVPAASSASVLTVAPTCLTERVSCCLRMREPLSNPHKRHRGLAGPTKQCPEL
jgi:hypothetical protein